MFKLGNSNTEIQTRALPTRSCHSNNQPPPTQAPSSMRHTHTHNYSQVSDARMFNLCR